MTQSTTAPPPDLTALKEIQHKVWSSGDYGRIAWVTVPVADDLVAAMELSPGSRVLDVATGTGHVALSSARTFCHATGIDYVPELVATARRRAAAEGLGVDFRVGDAEALPFEDGSFDYTLSAIGTMFTADHERAAREMVRVTRSGGHVGLASWTPAGFVGRMLKAVGAHVAPPPGSQPPTRWGDPTVVPSLLGDQVHDVRTWTSAVRQRFLDPAHFVDFFLENYGPTLKASEKLDERGRAAFRADLVRLADEANLATDGSFVADWEYLLVSARRR